MKGRIHSIESCGTVDGPGIRYIVFTQGCLLRCQYCHNADTWEINKGKEMTVEEIVTDMRSYIPFMEASGGGITVSGGEPLLQLDFLIAIFRECKKIGVHTALDSSGGCYTADPVFQEKLGKLMEYTDLVLLDIKHIDSKRHRKLTGKPNEHILQFARYLSNKKKPVWIRHVLVPGLTDGEEDLRNLRAFIDTLQNVEKVEVLPYHQLGVYKWEALGHKYPLKDIQPPTAETIAFANQILVSH
ncbi:pyruvate formate-lyase-activating protein [Ectobacillus sp. JY-23]|uniref:pyruvate formate-lyase-activating protein n=1 Tax=Ectobacillus sp. JY-23 TaxID=2933872 RepID=UPI001FF65734|nr:pyruvate formate-lyase-activating protein [Ectobacillus sp. JY-23]UOY93596.1 pyruvate formate-lyase-activating protein [Ectobacillus sp. JY-23]